MKKFALPLACVLLAFAALCIAGCAYRGESVRYAHVGFAGEGQTEPSLQVISSVEEKEELLARLPSGEGYDELPSLQESMQAFDEAFFSSQVLLVAYFPAESGSCRLSIKEVAEQGGQLRVTVVRELPEAQTEDIVGRAALISLTRAFWGQRPCVLAAE